MVNIDSIAKIIAKLHPLERIILPVTQETTLPIISAKTELQEIEVMRALQWLENKKIVTITTTKRSKVTLAKNGLHAKEHGLAERILLNSLTQRFQPLSIIAQKTSLSSQEINACIGILKRHNALMIRREDELYLALTAQGNKSDIASAQQSFLHQEFPLYEDNFNEDQIKAFSELKKRKDMFKLSEEKSTSAVLTEFGKSIASQKIPQGVINRLTPEMLKTGSWKEKTFREYDVEINVPTLQAGRRHPYYESLNIIRDVFLEMGFTEMKGPWVETAFWNMDIMWIPQDHPAREVQDTFYLDKKGDLPNDELIKKVKAAHENGFDTGSTGHSKEWNPEVAKQLLMRTHSTATSFRYLYEKKLNHDCKYFYIATNFRNEAIDATHLADFGQAEGFIVGDNLTLADLMGFIKTFYAKLGLTKIRFKPTFNPYTEPSMEAHYYNEKLGKWYSLINSGIFRPETLAPIGITKSVIAWGMGSSRIAAILSGKKKLKDLVGPDVDFNWIREHQRIHVEGK